MEERHKEYIEYYRVRMESFKDNPIYKNSYESEKALYDAISSCAVLEDFRDKVFNGKLQLKNAIAILKDKEKARMDNFNRLKEFVRAGAAKEILEKIEQRNFEKDIEIANFAAEIEQNNSKIISRDETGITEFRNDIGILETIEVNENAQVVNEFKNEANVERPRKEIARGTEHWEKHTLPNLLIWFPDWDIDYNEILTQERHRRKLPYPDEVVKKRIEQHKRYIGRKK